MSIFNYLLTLWRKSFHFCGKSWTFDLVGVPLDSICRVEGSVAVSPELKHPTTKHPAQILGNKIPRIFHTRTHTYTLKGSSSLLDQTEDVEVPASSDYRFPGRGEDDAAEL